MTWGVIDPETPLSGEERASFDRISALDLVAGRWLEEFLLSGRRYYLTWTESSPHMFLRLKNAQGLANWWTREWRRGPGRPQAVYEVTLLTFALLEQILTLPAESRPVHRGAISVGVTLDMGPPTLAPAPSLTWHTLMPKRPLAFVPLSASPTRSHFLTFGWWNEVPLWLKLDGDRFVARNSDDEWLSGSDGPKPQP